MSELDKESGVNEPELNESDLKESGLELSYAEDPVAKAAFDNFGIKYLFPWQRLVIANILEAYKYHNIVDSMTDEERNLFERDNSDSFCKGRQIVLLPTGAGKSLCFQVPALLFDGPSLIIYPLLALMTDQQRRMEEGSLRSVTFRGGQSEEERSENFRRIKEGARIILANPEVLTNDTLLQQLKNVGIKHIAIDEAHCTAEWGTTFRPSYLELGKVIKVLNPPVITAFTATASPEVLAKISEILFEGEAHVVRSESDRQNIHYFVKEAGAKKKAALYLAKTEKRPMIIFCGTRNNSEDMAQELNACFGGGTARFYHAGLAKEEKENIEQWFYKSKDGILCATCAYGMGVDKKDIKTVVHLVASSTAEAYIQEAGRGGRDGSVAKAILLWSYDDSINFGVFKPGSREIALKDFAETKACRRQVLLDALGAEQAVCSGCDLCNEREAIKNAMLLKEKEKKRMVKQIQNKKGVSDLAVAYRLIKKAPHFYKKEDFCQELSEKMNETYRKVLGVNAWNNKDSVEILNQLFLKGKVKESSWFWKGSLKALAGNNESVISP